MTRPDSGDIPSLNGLRAVSIGFVLLAHGIGFSQDHSFTFRLFLLHGNLGVRIFFVISGFLITTLLLKERLKLGSICLKLFYVRRFLRILPPFVLFAIALVVLQTLGYLYIPGLLWAHILTYTVNFTSGVWSTDHLWSLSVEEQFYLLWPLALRFVRLGTCAWIAIGSVFAGILIRGLDSITGIQLVNPDLRLAFPFVAGPIATGCLLAMAAPQVRDFILRHPNWFGSVALFAATMIVLLLDTFEFGKAAQFVELPKDVLLTLCVARFVFLPIGLVAAVLNSAPAVFIGKLSYSLYLWQQLFLNPFSDALICRFPLNLCAAFAVAWLSYTLVEKRFFALRKRFRREPVAIAAVAGAG